MIFSFAEVLDILVMTIAVGFIFKDTFKRQKKVEVLLPEGYDPLASQKFNWDDFWFAVAVVGPSIILHEFGHKFLALAFGMNAEFNAAYTWLLISLVLKIIGFGFIFFVPAYVSISGAGTPIEFSLVAFAGPAINLILWLSCAALIRTKMLNKKKGNDLYHIVFLSSKINMFLFIFNMLPIPGFDGWKVFSYLFSLFF